VGLSFVYSHVVQDATRQHRRTRYPAEVAPVPVRNASGIKIARYWFLDDPLSNDRLPCALIWLSLADPARDILTSVMRGSKTPVTASAND
jgi:hypothetical protein